jgi:hypothetical protein
MAMLLQAAEGGGIVMFPDIAIRKALALSKTEAPMPRRKLAKVYKVVR